MSRGKTLCGADHESNPADILPAGCIQLPLNYYFEMLFKTLIGASGQDVSAWRTAVRVRNETMSGKHPFAGVKIQNAILNVSLDSNCSLPDREEANIAAGEGSASV